MTMIKLEIQDSILSLSKNRSFNSFFSLYVDSIFFATVLYAPFCRCFDFPILVSLVLSLAGLCFSFALCLSLFLPLFYVLVCFLFLPFFVALAWVCLCLTLCWHFFPLLIFLVSSSHQFLSPYFHFLFNFISSLFPYSLLLCLDNMEHIGS